LGHKWRFEKKTDKWKKEKLKDQEAPQILFIERSLQFLKEGGRMAIVLPDGVFGNESAEYIRNCF
jgi:type I restriction enzyme M protein